MVKMAANAMARHVLVRRLSHHPRPPCPASSTESSARQSSTTTKAASALSSFALFANNTCIKHSRKAYMYVHTYAGPSCLRRSRPLLRLHEDHELGHTRYQSALAASTSPKPLLANLFPTDEYVDVWSLSSSSSSSSPSSSPPPHSRRIQPLHCPELDKPTRFLLSLLDDSIHGIRRGKDKATTARCHRQLKRLADTSVGGKRLEGRAQRADEILKRMETILFINGNGNANGNGNDSAHNDASGSGSNGSISSISRGSSKSLYAAQHKYERPLPNRQTYLMVLRLYAQTSGPAALAERAEAIVAGMELASEQLGDLSLRPQTVAHNQVISAWASSTDPNKAYRAATVLATLKAMDLADASSYGHVLRACATTTASSVDAGDDEPRNNSQQAALKIATGLWKDLDGKAMKRRTKGDDDNTDEENDNAELLSSHFYTFLLRTLDFMPASKPLERDAAVSKAFKNCCRDGMVNAHVLQVLYSVASKSTCRDLLGDRLASQAEGAMKTISGAAILAQKVPDAWTRKAVVVNSWGW
mmetsp:Transcript_11948/g.34186  ORF Transcript_11948/g.34186 Transcript_11948/m.34186 type:complete len:531 (+) Transcript_11948:114-1706(+)